METRTLQIFPPMSNATFDLFRFRINNKRFDDEAIRVLESMLVSKDVKSSIQVRSSLTELLRSEYLSFIRENTEKTVEQKLLVLDFFVRAFALVGDVQSCLALRYEAFVLRDLKSASCEGLQVSHIEWLTFAEQLLENGFCAIAGKAYKNALSCLLRNNIADLETDEMSEVTEKIKRLKDHAVTLAGSHSVQAQAAEYLKKKTIDMSKINSSYCKEKKCAASTLFRNGIKLRNLQKLQESLRHNTSGSYAVQDH